MKIKILLADDELRCRNTFQRYLNLFFPSGYSFEIVESYSASIAKELLHKSKETKDFFDIVVADINFSENEFHEDSNAGFEIIELSKQIHPKAKIVWYSAQNNRQAPHDVFKKESKFLKNGFIDYQIRKSSIVESFEKEMYECLKQIENEKQGLIYPLSQLFGTYNYAPDENEGFYKITHLNFDWEEMRNLLPRIRGVYDDMKIKDLLKIENAQSIENYLKTVEIRRPFENELYDFKSRFRFEFSENLFNKFQLPLLRIGVKSINNFSFSNYFTIFAENDRLSRGFSTLYENIAQHNFPDHYPESTVSTLTKSDKKEFYIEITSNGIGFNPFEAFNSVPVGGLRSIYNSFNYYCSLIYESNGIYYDVYQNLTQSSDIREGVKISLKFNLPPVIERERGEIIEA